MTVPFRMMACSRIEVLSPITTPASITENAPTPALLPICASGETSAVGCVLPFTVILLPIKPLQPIEKRRQPPQSFGHPIYLFNGQGGRQKVGFVSLDIGTRSRLPPHSSPL